MDKRTTSWILEFLLRQPVDNWVIHRLISILPTSDEDIRLKKALILRGISSIVSKDTISEKILDSLEEIDKLGEPQEGSRVSESMKSAYCAVAVDCAARFLREDFGDSLEFLCAVDMIWKGRVSSLESLESCGLISDSLSNSKKEMMAAVVNYHVRVDLSGRDTKKEALDRVRVFLEEATKDMGLSFLESVAREKQGEGHKNVAFLRNLGERSSVCEEDDDMTLPPSWTGMAGGNSPLEEASASVKFINCSTEETHANLQVIETSQGMDQRISNGDGGTKFNPVQTREVIKLQEALISSSKNLKAAVEDPLPEALETAAKILSAFNTSIEQNEGHSDKNQNQEVLNGHAAADKGIETTNKEVHTSNNNDRINDGTSWPGFMVRNPTARTYEWDDDLDESASKNSPTHSRGVRLPSPKHGVVSPLKTREAKKFARRRKIKKWSPQEEETLRNAVLKHGKGNWKFILNSYRQVFEDRTEHAATSFATSLLPCHQREWETNGGGGHKTTPTCYSTSAIGQNAQVVGGYFTTHIMVDLSIKGASANHVRNTFEEK